MLLLTLLVLEGMGRLAYYAAYGQGYGGGGLDGLIDITPPPPNFPMQGQTSGRYAIPFTAMSVTCLTTT